MKLRSSLFIFTSLCALGFTTQSHAATLIYESFSQTPGNLNGVTGGGSLNPTTWAGTGGTNPTTVQGTGLSYSTLSVAGGTSRLGLSTTGQQNSNASIDIGTTLSSTTLLDNGSTLWFSFLYNPTGVTTNDAAVFALATNAVGTNTTFSSGSQAIGVNISRNSQVNAAYWNNVVSSDNKSSGASDGTTVLIVGEIIWGANDLAAETINIYLPGADLLQPGTAFSTRTTAALTQSAFDTITFAGKQVTNHTSSFDEIRFGASYADVVVVPEPSAALLVCLGCLLLLRRRR